MSGPTARAVTLDADGIPISGLLAEPPHGPPRAVVVALHGSGMSAGYFDNRAGPGLSLLTLGAELGYTVLSLDRPGYGASARQLPLGQNLADQTGTLGAALAAFRRSHDHGAGLFLLAHSNGGRLALSTAAAEHAPPDLIGLDVSGLGSMLAVGPGQLPGSGARGAWRRHWGALRLYPPGAFLEGQRLVRPVPDLEARETLLWPRMYAALAARVRVPVRFTFAEQEQWWRSDEEAVRALLAPLAGAPAEVVGQPDAGHNISLGRAARTYHLRALAFLEECLLARESAAPVPRAAQT
ncbi:MULTISPECIES: alpha/beta fold hydrolase [Streptomyces]|uniref:alpha/beta hydrolase n=1 Tax=Streptomyces TaxID=1883 RepID=UPI0020BDB730|nr:alpha/beta fold hydrolase [Streptomyces sp. 43Y-GA-1]MCL6291360.1 alpha/beta hydrolase [Streptomyces sp. 43Y-GA-1]